jgi:hypothetical protein
MSDMEATADLTEQIREAIAAHGVWRSRVFEALETGKSTFVVENVGRDDLCPFGQWLHGAIPAELKSSPHYVRVRELHALMHHEGARLVQVWLGGAGSPSGTAVAAGEAAQARDRFTAASTALVRALMAWKQDHRAAA